MKPTAVHYAQALHAALQESGDQGADQIIDNLMQVLAQDGSLDLYPQIITAFEELVASPERDGPRVVFGRPQHLGKSEADALNAAAKAQQSVQETVADELVGGVVIRMNDTVVDGSVAGALARMRGQLSED